MNYRCPVCRINLGERKLSRIVARMEIDCPNCKQRLRLNMHPAEMKAVVLSFVAFVTLAAIGYGLQSQGLVLLAFGSGAAGAVAVVLLERTRLRDWPRYVPRDERVEL